MQRWSKHKQNVSEVEHSTSNNQLTGDAWEDTERVYAEADWEEQQKSSSKKDFEFYYKPPTLDPDELEVNIQEKYYHFRAHVEDEHRAFITEAEELKSVDLLNRIRELRSLDLGKPPIQGARESDGLIPMPGSEEKNIFSVILRKKDLTSAEKIAALTILLREKSYPAAKLFSKPAIDDLLAQDTIFNPTIYDNYHECSFGKFNKQHELEIWKRLAKTDYAHSIFEFLLIRGRFHDSAKFVIIWINSLNNIKDIAAVSKIFESTRLEQYFSYLNKVADQRVLTLELEKTTSKVPEEKKADKDVSIKAFLSSHRSFFSCFCCKTPAEKIYQKLAKQKLDEVKSDLATQQVKIDQEFRKQFS